MKKVAWMLLLLTAGCDKQELSIEPDQLIGTWHARPNTEKMYSRWTFNKEYLYKVSDSSRVCTGAQSQPYKYWIENDVLVARYYGFNTGLVPIPDERYRLFVVSSKSFVVEFPKGQRVVFEKCP
jgi:hypothetical protein